MGQALLPEHFYAQETSLREETGARLGIMSTPQWGIGSLEWDSFQLLEGVLSLQELTLVLPSGTLIDIPGNSDPTSFNLNSTGSSRTPVYVHLQSAFKVVSVDLPGESDEESIDRVVQKLQLSAQPYSDTAHQVFKLGEFERGPDGVWAVVEDFMPAMVRVTGSPFFEPHRKRIESVCNRLQQQLLGEVQANYLAGENQAAARQAMRGLYEIRAYLANVGADLHPHPYEVFQAVTSLYIQVCVYRECEPVMINEPYRHDSFHKSLDGVLRAIEEQVDLARSDTPYQPFELREGVQVCDVPREAKRARSIYWLVQKPRVSSKLDTAGVKLASESRLNIVHQRALRGIPVEKVDTPPFHHDFSPQVEFYRLAAGEEWDHAVRESRLAFFQRDDMKDMRSFLYWRTD